MNNLQEELDTVIRLKQNFLEERTLAELKKKPFTEEYDDTESNIRHM